MPTIATSLTEERVEELERSRWVALMGADLATLTDLFADDLVYTHSNGARDTKQAFLGRLESGALRYLRLEPVETSTNVYGDVAVVTGDVTIEALVPGGTHETVVAYTAVWTVQGDRAVHVAWHSSPKA